MDEYTVEELCTSDNLVIISFFTEMIDFNPVDCFVRPNKMSDSWYKDFGKKFFDKLNDLHNKGFKLVSVKEITHNQRLYFIFYKEPENKNIQDLVKSIESLRVDLASLIMSRKKSNQNSNINK